MNVPLQSLIVILLGHWVGDYLLQGNIIADQKSKSIRWLTIHVLVYTITLIVFSLFLFSWADALRLSFLNGIFHFITDLFTSRLSSKCKLNPRIFYTIIGFDQLIHTATLIATTYYYYDAL